LEFVLARPAHQVAADEGIELGDQVVDDEGLIIGRGSRKSTELLLNLTGLMSDVLDDLRESKSSISTWGQSRLAEDYLPLPNQFS
jgi:hypothetical protein